MKRKNSIQNIRRKKAITLGVLFAFVAISQFAFFHHILVEKHASVHFEKEMTSGAHDHCASSSIANPNIILAYVSFTSFIHTHHLSSFDTDVSILTTPSTQRHLRGPPSN